MGRVEAVERGCVYAADGGIAAQGIRFCTPAIGAASRGCGAVIGLAVSAGWKVVGS